jgi:hypothetical protein
MKNIIVRTVINIDKGPSSIVNNLLASGETFDYPKKDYSQVSEKDFTMHTMIKSSTNEIDTPNDLNDGK